jgi:hypothetical protein
VSSNEPSARVEYVREVLRLYTATPGVLGRIRAADRILAGRLFDRGVPIYAVQNAFVLAAARRILHNAFSAPMPPIRSLHYFQGVIQEVLERPPGYREISLLREQLAATQSRS